jgi:hypothetical protein
MKNDKNVENISINRHLAFYYLRNMQNRNKIILKFSPKGYDRFFGLVI